MWGLLTTFAESLEIIGKWSEIFRNWAIQFRNTTVDYYNINDEISLKVWRLSEITDLNLIHILSNDFLVSFSLTVNSLPSVRLCIVSTPCKCEHKNNLSINPAPIFLNYFIIIFPLIAAVENMQLKLQTFSQDIIFISARIYSPCHTSHCWLLPHHEGNKVVQMGPGKEFHVTRTQSTSGWSLQCCHSPQNEL